MVRRPAWPPCASAISRTIARPRPEPGRPRASAAAVEAIEHQRQVVRREARAVVAHLHAAAACSDLDDAVGRAPRRGIVQQVGQGALEPARLALDHGRGARRARSAARGRGGAPGPTACSASTARSTATNASSTSTPCASDTTSFTRSVSSASWAETSPTSSRRSAADRRWLERSSTSRLVRALVSGVRSSCEASATSRRCEARACSTAASMALKRSARRPSSSWLETSMRRERSCVVDTCSAASVSSRTGASTARDPRRPSAAASRVAPAPTATSSSTRRSRVASTSPAGRTNMTATPGATGAVTMRTVCPSTLRSDEVLAPASRRPPARRASSRRPAAARRAPRSRRRWPSRTACSRPRPPSSGAGTSTRASTRSTFGDRARRPAAATAPGSPSRGPAASRRRARAAARLHAVVGDRRPTSTEPRATDTAATSVSRERRLSRCSDAPHHASRST